MGAFIQIGRIVLNFHVFHKSCLHYNSLRIREAHVETSLEIYTLNKVLIW